MAENGFHVLGPGERGNPFDTAYLTAADARFGDAPRCAACGAFLGMRTWQPPFRVELELHGTEWGDFAFFGSGAFLVTARAAELMQGAAEVVEKVEPVTVSGGAAEPPDYYRVDVPLVGPSVDEEKSAITRNSAATCDACKSTGIDAIRGFAIEAASGGDLFVASDLPGVVIVNSRLRRHVEDLGLTNVTFTPTGDYRWDPGLTTTPRGLP